MSGWAGFSEDELRSVQKKESAIASVRKLRPPNLSRQQLQREMSLRTAQTFAGFVSHDLQPEKPLNKLSPRGVHDSTAKMDMQHCLGEEKKQENCKAAIVKQNPAIKEPEKQKIELHDKTRLEHLKSEQKIIEESNKRKKALLAKTIAAKSQQTQAEAVKLKRIQIELQALDDQVSNDIGILRGKIEQASWDYTTARKRYDKAETEYVKAKLDLHKKTDLKEQLTEHLYAIIQQNELHKSIKLEELMQQLQLCVTDKELEMQKVEEHNVGNVELQDVKEHYGVMESHERTVQWMPTENGSQKKFDGITLEQKIRIEKEHEQDCKAEKELPNMK
ncbi:RAB6-interacting golgin isoform X1 [Stigmatopora argus]